MGWTETCAVEERMRFVLAVQEHEESFAAVCRQFGVSRRVGYKWLARFEEEGAAGLFDRPRRTVRSRRADGKAQAAPTQPAVERALCRLRGSQRHLVHRLQGLVPDRRRQALRAADAHRCVQPLSAALPGAGADRYGSCLAGAGCGVPRVWAAALPAFRQWLAVCLTRCRRAVAVVGQTDQGRRDAGAHRTGQATTEWPPRTHAPDPAAGGRQSAG